MNFYFKAVEVLDKLDAKKGSVKGLISTVPEKDRKRTAALVLETLKYKEVLLEVISSAKLLQEEKRKLKSTNLALVLVHDLLLCKGIQAGDGVIKQAILRHKTRLRGEFQKIKIKKGATSNQDLIRRADPRTAQIPRYARVNTLLWNTEEAIKYFLARGFTLGAPLDLSTAFAVDNHIPDLLLFPPQTVLNDDPAYQSGKIILQDKASCMPAVVLAPPSRDNSVVIDATAAPGNKTSHLSALMGNRGKLYAFERDRRRYATLTMMLSKAGCKNVESLNVDFLSVDPADPRFSPVTHVLLDPSCSGSGIVNRMDYLIEDDQEDDIQQGERLGKLSAFQLSMIKHAMKFPRVEKIVYSTCSVYAEENEHVVRAALNSNEASSRGFKLAPFREVLPPWHRRGLPNELDSEDDAACLIRCSPGDDNTNGFFVSCFVREITLRMKKRRLTSNEPEKLDSTRFPGQKKIRRGDQELRD